ncbi:MAG: hypothetical protein QF598_01525 [Arenicellales bacterium]|jgi:hypothetical protein|nr:hypothetical protein [Arenicellales bacterium]MDP6947896.1 hypothetical protein [Arenicellales bacterium]
MSGIPDFTQVQIETVRSLLLERYCKIIDVHVADCEILLEPGHEELTECPALFWHANDANFVVIRTNQNSYRCQFFYTPNDQYGTGHEQYHVLDECVMAVLKVQSDHAREKHGVTSGVTGADLSS